MIEKDKEKKFLETVQKIYQILVDGGYLKAPKEE